MKLVRLLTIVVVAAFFSSTASAQQMKLASVDMAKVFADYYKTKKAESELKDRADNYQKDLRQQVADLQKMEEDGKKLQDESDNPAFTDEKKAEKKKMLETKKTEYRLARQNFEEMKQNRERELFEQRNRVRSTIVDEIIKIVQEKAKKEGYTMVVDKTGLTQSGVPPFIYLQETLDITGDVLKTLNGGAPAAAAAPAAKDATPAPAAAAKDSKK